MPKDQSFHDYVISDVLNGIPGITSRFMFGGWGIYQNGIIFGLIADGALYFKVGTGNKADFEKLGSHPFEYSSKNGKSATMSYWLVPEEIIENSEKIAQWVEQSVTQSKPRP